ncbi:MAG: TlpA family protein disulfide reductase [Prolixibacteraceae bacterium]|jgi:peroxiredoxin|nr:TlpA family protein disulfide reductase [Prolixibacteraceae bacterium]
MKKLTYTFLITVSLFLVSFSTFAQMPVKQVPADYGYIVKIGDKIPEFTTTLISGKTFSNADFKGKVVMLQFTASWCSVCRKEMPFIERDIWLKNKDNKNFVLVGVDLDEPLEKVVNFQKDINVTYPMALDPGGKIFGLIAEKKAGVTRNIILDKTGKIVYLTRLYKEDEFAEMVKVIETLLK